MSDGFAVEGDGGSISVTPGALAAIVRRAAEAADGARVRRRRGLEVRVEGARAHVELALTAPFGAVLPELARAVQGRVADALATACGLSSVVDVAVEELDGS